MKKRFQSALTLVSGLALLAFGAVLATDFALPGTSIYDVLATVIALVLSLAATIIAVIRLGASSGNELHDQPSMKVTPVIWLFITGLWLWFLVAHLLELVNSC